MRTVLFQRVGCALLLLAVNGGFASEREERLHEGFVSPPVECRPHTRWWWMGNALRKEDIAGQLDQMRAQGIGGVEQITMEEVYEKGNHPYLSPEYFALLRYAVEQAHERGMEFSINFGGPGWIWGGEWVPKEDQSKVLLASEMTLTGPQSYRGPLSFEAVPNPNDLPRSVPDIGEDDRLVKVVAGRFEEGRFRLESLVDISALARGREIAWDVPEGTWRVMAFWLTQRNHSDAVDHLSVDAMKRYCDGLGARYADAVGTYFGTTVESFFSDSFEVPIQRNGLYWSDGLFEAFREAKGYDLVPLLPALWREVDELSPKVRYDANEFLHAQGMRAFFGSFLEWCARHGVKGRIQPYGFVTDTIEGAGAADIPEMEITAGEKDAVPWFDTRIGPKQYVASGAHLYGRNVVSTEAFTYLHWEPYRETLAELKIATDGYLCAGANKIFNHGFIASPERCIVPVRGFFEAIRISPENIWWPYYHLVTDYTSRSCWLLRQGKPVVDVAVYSPLANQWSQSVHNARKWTREFEWGGLGALLLSNGYSFDLVNDDVLQHRARFEGAALHLGEMTYRVLILPEVDALPVETYRQIEAYIRQGGAVVALERCPSASTGMRDRERNDAEVLEISKKLFGTPVHRDDTAMKTVGEGKTFCIETVLRREDQLDWRSAPLDPFVKTLRRCVPPDFDVDLVRDGLRTNEGLTFIHRHDEAMDLYFVANMQDRAVAETVGFRVNSGQPYFWAPEKGTRTPVWSFRRDGEYTRLPLTMMPFGSRFVVFEGVGESGEEAHVTWSDFEEVASAEAGGFTALASRNGGYGWEFSDGKELRRGTAEVSGIPAPFEVGGMWEVRFLGRDEAANVCRWPRLISWTEEDAWRHFSGQARYAIGFELPGEYFAADLALGLSLGVVGNIAEIRLNGVAVGTQWMDGQEFAVDGIAKVGENRLEVVVMNTLINRVAGMDAFPEVAEELRPIFGEGKAASTAEAEALKGFEPLPRSGLLGPVRIVALRRVRVG